MSIVARKIKTFLSNPSYFIEWSREKIRRYRSFLVPRLIEKYTLHRNNYDIRDTVVLTGPPRSGSTWLFELLSEVNEYTGIYEPLLLDWFPESITAGFNQRQYLRPSSEDKLKKDYLEKNAIFNNFVP